MSDQKILIVDDDLADIIITKKVLGDALPGVESEVIREASDALKWLQSGFRPQLIISDLKMPNMDGFEFLSALKTDKNFQNIPVIIMSTSSADEDINKCLEMNANAYMVKPCCTSEFEHTISELREFWQDSLQIAA